MGDALSLLFLRIGHALGRFMRWLERRNVWTDDLLSVISAAMGAGAGYFWDELRASIKHWASDPTDPWSHDHEGCPRCRIGPTYGEYCVSVRGGQLPDASVIAKTLRTDAIYAVDPGETTIHRLPDADLGDAAFTVGADRIYLPDAED